MSNHHHVVLFDRHGTYPEFLQRFHQQVARCLNAHRGRWDYFWDGAAPSVVHLITPEDVMRKLVYTATNPVIAHLVERVHQWPGVNGYGALLRGEPLTVTRPSHFYRDDGPMPEEVTLELVIPPELGDRTEVLRELQARVEAVEAMCIEERRKTGRRVLGRRRVKEQSPFACPETFEPRRNIQPRVAAKNKWARIEALQRNREFVKQYVSARRQWLAGITTIFPRGVYWLRRFANVPFEPSPDRFAWP